METLTLKELKAQNTESELQESKPAAKDEYIEVDPETEEPIEVEEPEALEVDEEAEQDSEESSEELSEDLEYWQKSESEEDSKGKFKPSAEAKKLRLKNKDLKAEKEERDAELESLRQKVESLVSKPAEVKPEAPARPKLDDFDYDEDRYAEALDHWYDTKLERKAESLVNNTQKQAAEKQQFEAQQQARESAVLKHLDKAAKLINDNKITEDDWMAADLLVRQSLELSFPGKGNDVADQLIALMENNGEGGEKAWYHLGKNPTALTSFRDKLTSDQTGSAGVMYLAGIQQKISQSIRKKRSDAPKPAPTLNGDSPVKSSASKKRYDKMTDSGDRVRYKRKCKKAGEDVSKW